MSARKRSGPVRATDQSLLEQMAESMRVLRKARMLPTDRPLTPDEIMQVSRDFDRWLKETRRSATSVSKALGSGYSEARISHFRNGKFVGNAEELARVLNQFMEQQARAADVARPEGFVETEVASKMLTTIQNTIDAKAMGLIYGPAGVGKTMTLEAAHKITPGSLYVRVMSASHRGTGLSIELANMLGIRASNNFSTRVRLVVDALKGTGRPLLIDEAHQLIDTGVEVLRDIHDLAGVPVILCGTVDIKKLVDDASAFFGQISSRIMIRCDITEQSLRPRNPRPLYSIDEVRAIFQGPKLRLTDDGAQFLCELACVPGLGSLRLAKQIVIVAASLPKVDRMAIDAQVLRRVLRQLHGDSWAKLIAERRDATLERIKVA